MAAMQGQVNSKGELGAPVTQVAWKQQPVHYIVADNDRMIPPASEVQMAARVHSKIVHLAASHAVMLSHPDEVAAVILNAAQ